MSGFGLCAHPLTEFPLLHGEIPAGGAIRFLQRTVLVLHRLDLSRARGPKIHHRQRFFNVQFPRAAFGVHAVVVVEAVGQVGAFLPPPQTPPPPHGPRRPRPPKKTYPPSNPLAPKPLFTPSL